MKNTDQTLLLPLNIYDEIINGKYTAKQDIVIFNKFLNILYQMHYCPVVHSVMSLPTNVKKFLPCISHNEKSPYLKQISYLRDLFQNNQLKNSFNFLKSFIDQQQQLSEQNIEKLLSLCSKFLSISLFDLKLTAIEKKDIVQSYFDLFASISRFPETVTIEKNNHEVNNLISLSKSFLTKLSKLDSNTTITSTPSNLTDSIDKPIESYLRGLGNLALHYRKNQHQANLSTVENSAITLINDFAPLPNQSSHLKRIFISQYHSANDVQEACAKLFNLSNSHKFTTANETQGTTTLTTLSETTSTMPVITATNQATQTVVHNATITEFPTYPNNIQPSQKTSAKTSLSSEYPSVTTMGASFAHGFASGLINFLAQGTSMYLRKKGIGKSSIPAILLSLTNSTLQASYMATFPLMLLKLNTLIAQGHHEEAQRQWEMMTSDILPTFFTSLGLSTGLQLLNYLSENYLAKQPTIKSLVQSIPMLSTFWSFTQNPILTVIQVVTASTVSSAGLFGCNRYFATSNRSNSGIEANKNHVELQSSNKGKNTPIAGALVTESKIGKTYQYISPEKFLEVKKETKMLLSKLEAFQSSIENKEIIAGNKHVLEIIKTQVKIMTDYVSHLEDKIHGNADKIHTDEKQYFAAMEKLGNVFKLFKPELSNMKGKLQEAEGYIKGKNASVPETRDTLDVLEALTEIRKFIDIPESLANIYLKKYDLAPAVEKAKRSAAAEEKITNGNPHSKTNNSSTENRRHTFSGNSDNYRTSTASSDRSDKSTASRNSAYNPIDQQQEVSLLNSTSFKI